MPYSQALGRSFWYAFDDYFKYQAGQNGMGAKYSAMGGYNAPAQRWSAARQAGNYPEDFAAYAEQNRETITSLADEQETFFRNYLGGDEESIVRAFQDFAFGVLASPTKRPGEPVHTMNGGRFARDYLNWQGFIEAAVHLDVSTDFWESLRWINGMAWELQAKADPQEVYPNQNEPLPAEVTAGIREKWADRTPEQIAVEFDNYSNRPVDWLSA